MGSGGLKIMTQKGQIRTIFWTAIILTVCGAGIKSLFFGAFNGVYSDKDSAGRLGGSINQLIRTLPLLTDSMAKEHVKEVNTPGKIKKVGVEGTTLTPGRTQ